ncbi:MAG: sensor histidine kinase [Arenicellales bacterium]|nr:sensor histidine kinase [Arenicellales bacterium]
MHVVAAQKRRLGLWGKLVIAILLAGSVPIVIGLSVAYVRGTTELQEVIGASFKALAEESASKVDAEIRHVIAADRALAVQAASDPQIRGHLAKFERGPEATDINWPEISDNNGTIHASWVSGPARGPIGSDQKNPAGTSEAAPPMPAISGLQLSGEPQRYLIRVATPILEADTQTMLGWLHRDHIVKSVFDPLIYPARFGNTGHVMIIDNQGAIVSCPLLITGSRIEDLQLVKRVAQKEAGWITAENDGHGSRKFSIIGHAPLPEVNELLHAGVSWHMFVWQDTQEIFAPARSLLVGVALAGLLAIGVLGILGYYSGRRILNPIRRLSQEATRIASGDLNQKLDIRTGDEIEDLANRFDDMRVQLGQLIGKLEEKVEERTRELQEAQDEKDRVMQKLIQAEKVSAIGTMASGIGHEINNPLYAIHGMAEAIRDEKDISLCNEYGEDILKYTKHIAEIVKNLSGYIRPATQHDMESVDVNGKLTEAITMAQRSLLSDRIEIKKDFSSVPPISAKSEEIMQVFFNVIRNGIQAIDGVGRLEVSSRVDDGKVWIRIKDSGAGIPAEHLGKIFDPFFTTKDPDQGEGMGLYIVQQIVKKYDGSIHLDSQQGVGTVCTIQFPIAEKSQEKHNDS